MPLESTQKKERRRTLDKIDREIIRDFLSLITVDFTVHKGPKHTRSEALREVLLEFYKDRPEMLNAVKRIDKKRELDL